ncbi:MAG: glycosyltransferase [Methylococcus sp.]|nr:MAG: glycosyltransferase [Methylococcus sp.]
MTLGSRVLFFSPSFGDGGVERDTVNLANGFIDLGVSVRLMTRAAGGAFLDQLRPGVERITLSEINPGGLGRELEQVLREHPGSVVLSCNDADDRIAIAVKRRLNGQTGARFYIRVGTAIVSRIREDRFHHLTGWLQRRRLSRLYRDCDGVITTSRGAAREIVNELKVPHERVTPLPNPTLTPGFGVGDPPTGLHPWFAPGQPPVIIAIGRLARVKDYPTLMRAFAKLRAQRDCRLLILGQGRQRSRLEALADELAIGGDVDLLGFCPDPYGYLRQSRLLVVSSTREGGPIVLIEALALGIPVVSTDCPTGPREILQDGRYGRLVPMENPDLLAEAMAETLDHPPAPDFLRQAAAPYTQMNSSRKHLRTMGLGHMLADYPPTLPNVPAR